MISAKDAREMYNENLETNALEMLAKVNEGIVNTCTNSQGTSITMYGSKYEVIVPELQRLGYMTNVISDFQGYSLNISWAQ